MSFKRMVNALQKPLPSHLKAFDSAHVKETPHA